MLYNVTNIGYGGAYLNTQLPKILAELQGLTISGPINGAAANTPIPISDKGGPLVGDTILKVLAFTGGVPADQTVNASVVDIRATGSLTLLSTIANGDVIQVNGKSYTLTSMIVTPSTNIAPHIIPIKLLGSGLVDLSGTANAVAAAIMSGDSTLTCIALGAVVTIMFSNPGVAGNAVALAVPANGHITASGAFLTGGSATNSIVITTSTVGASVVVFWYKRLSPGYVPL